MTTDKEELRKIKASWEQYRRDGSTVSHMRRVLYPDTKRTDWFKVVWFSVVATVVLLIAAILVF